jgi:hypothetical protein
VGESERDDGDGDEGQLYLVRLKKVMSHMKASHGAGGYLDF